MAKYRLRLKRLDFISAVDTPAQETATALLLKGRDSEAQITATARVVKTSSDELGLVFGWALTVKADGAEYFDLHGDNIVEEDLIRVAAEFMANGGATDQQHDFERDGRVVFAMPLTAEVAKSFDIQTDTTGLMVAIKPSAEVFAKFKSGEYTGFSIAGVGEREPVEKSKDGDITVADLHARIAVLESNARKTVTRLDADSASLLAASPWLKNESLVADLESRISVLECAAHKSTQPQPVNNPEVKMDTKIVVLTDAQHAHYAKLAPADAEAFLAKSDAERAVVMVEVEKANAVEYTSEDGIVYRKSDDPRLISMAKQLDESKRVAKAESAARELVELKKRAADTIGKVAGSDDCHVALLKAVESIEDDKLRGEAIAALKSANEFAAQSETAPGLNPGGEPKLADATAEYDALVTETAKSLGGDRSKAADAVLKTKRGKELYAAITKKSKKTK